MDEMPVDEVEAQEASMEEGVNAGREDLPSPGGDLSGSGDEWQDVDDELDGPSDDPSDASLARAEDDFPPEDEPEEAPAAGPDAGPDSGPYADAVPGSAAGDEPAVGLGDDSDGDEDRGGPGPGAGLTDEQIAERALSLLFASPDPLSVGRLVSLLERPPAARVRAALDAIRHQLEGGPLPVQLRALKGGYTLMTVPEMGEVVSRLAKGSAIERISPAALETLAIVAYRQPVTKAEIEAIRGVQAGPILRSLVDRGLAKVTGRADVPGHPLQYGTTKDFLDRFGLMSLEELPRDAELAKD